MRRFNILLVDDEELALHGIEEAVDWDALNVDKVFKAHSMETAIRMIKRNVIDIVLTDVEMPGGSGLELIRWIQENHPNIPSVFFSGHAEFFYAQEAMRLGAVDYFLKPVDYQELEKLLIQIQQKILVEEKNLHLTEIMEVMPESTDGTIIEQVKQIIIENLKNDLQRDELASMVHVSPGHLSRLFKKEEGIAISDYILKKRLAVAKQLLQRTSLSVTAVSNRVGISHASYLSKLFKEQEGMSPQQYRMKYKRDK